MTLYGFARGVRICTGHPPPPARLAVFSQIGLPVISANRQAGITRCGSKIGVMSTSGKQRKVIREAKRVKASGGEPMPAQKKLLRTKRREVQRGR